MCYTEVKVVVVVVVAVEVVVVVVKVVAVIVVGWCWYLVAKVAVLFVAVVHCSGSSIGSSSSW